MLHQSHDWVDESREQDLAVADPVEEDLVDAAGLGDEGPAEDEDDERGDEGAAGAGDGVVLAHAEEGIARSAGVGVRKDSSPLEVESRSACEGVQEGQEVLRVHQVHRGERQDERQDGVEVAAAVVSVQARRDWEVRGKVRAETKAVGQPLSYDAGHRTEGLGSPSQQVVDGS